MYGVQAAVDADQEMLVFDFLAVVDTNLAEFFSQGVIAGEDSTVVPIAAQGVGWKKRGAADGAQAAGELLVMRCAQTLGGIFNNRQVVFLGNGVDPGHVRALAVYADRHDGPGVGVMAGSICEGSMLKVSGWTSIKTGLAPKRAMTSAVDIQV